MGPRVGQIDAAVVALTQRAVSIPALDFSLLCLEPVTSVRQSPASIADDERLTLIVQIQ